MQTRRLRINWGDGKVGGLLSGPGEGDIGVLLAPGAGAGQDSPFMARIRRGLAETGLPTLTFNYPYQEAERKSPDSAKRLLACHRAAADRLADRCGRVVLAGKSMGGRMGSHLVGDEQYECAGLVYFGYPLVPPGRGPRPTDHLGRIPMPQLFWCGGRDRLGPPELIEDLAAGLPNARAITIEGANHSFKVPKASGRSWGETLYELVDGTARFIAAL